MLQTGGQTDLSLRLKYWGVGEWKSHEFDILVDDVLVKEVNNTGKYRISEFKYETYPVPAELLKGKTQVRVKFVTREELNQNDDSLKLLPPTNSLMMLVGGISLSLIGMK